MKASEIMTEAVQGCSPQSTVQDVAQRMQQLDTGVIPIVDGESGSGRLVGLVTDRDLALRVLAEGRGPETPAFEAMSENVRSIGPDDDVEDVRHLMSETQVRRVPVCDEQGRLLGIISQADLALDDRIDDRAVGRTVEDVSRPSSRAH